MAVIPNGFWESIRADARLDQESKETNFEVLAKKLEAYAERLNKSGVDLAGRIEKMKETVALMRYHKVGVLLFNQQMADIQNLMEDILYTENRPFFPPLFLQPPQYPRRNRPRPH